MIPRPPRSTLCPCTTLFRSVAADRARGVLDDLRRGRSRAWIGASFGYPTLEDPAAGPVPEGLFLRSEEATSELQPRQYLVCRLLPEKYKTLTILDLLM